jgi:dsDNA-specific endonuclease/ATPase MutS2
MAQLFTIGTHNRSTKTLEEQMIRQFKNIYDTNEPTLQDAITAINNQNYSQAIQYINDVIEDLAGRAKVEIQ